MTAVLIPEPDKLPVTPDWLKAEQLFRTRYHYAVTSAHGMERLAFRVLPYSLLRSFALTFDPTEPFRLGSQKIAPVNRTRTRTIKGLHFSRYATYRNSNSSFTKNPNAFLCEYVPSVESSTSSGFDSSLYNDAPNITWISKDTTKRTRKPNESMGEFESFVYSPNSTDRSVTRIDTNHVTSVVNPPCPKPGISKSRTVETRHTNGGAAVFSSSQVASLRANIISATNQVMTNNLTPMLKDTVPSARRYNLVREVFELRDLPRSVISLQQTLRDLGSALKTMPRSKSDAFYRAKLAEHVPNEYLSYWFGWVLTFKAIRELLEAPAKISKEVNFLIKRRGKPTTLRRTKKVLGGTLTTPGWSYSPSTFSGTLWSETALADETVCTFETELRLVINALFDFPEVGVPKLRSDLLDRKWGVTPTLTDVYNVVPWTWLLDWFTGLGNYVELIDNINTDQTLYNWGVLTGVTTGRVRTTHRTYFDNSRRWAHSLNGVTTSGSELSRVNTTHESVCEFTATVRKDVVSSFGVRSTLKPSSMTTYQQSIVGALLGQRSGIARM